MDLRIANWIVRIAEAKPTTVDDNDNNSQQYTGSCGSRGSGIKEQPNRMNAERNKRRFASGNEEVPNSNNTSVTNSCNSSRNTSREQSRESSLNKVSATSASTSTITTLLYS
ncbi:unnamed protein product, partial [Adineta steineri]